MKIDGGKAYRILLYAGCVAGIHAGARTAPAVGAGSTEFAVAAAALLPIGLTGARYLHHLRRRQGEAPGAAVYGGLLAVLPASIPLLWALGIKIGDFWDAASISMLVGLIVTKAGCRMNGCCAGHPLGNRGWRVPARALEASWAAITLALAWMLISQRRFEGEIFALTIGSYGTGRLLFELAREQRARTNTVISLGLIAVSALLYALGRDA